MFLVMGASMNISSASQKTGLSAKTIRYYEQRGLVRPSRSENGYRVYTPQDLSALCFLQRTRATGFGLQESRELLELYRNPDRHSRDVKELVGHTLQRVHEKIQELQLMAETLDALYEGCGGGDDPQCPIITRLADQEAL